MDHLMPVCPTCLELQIALDPAYGVLCHNCWLNSGAGGKLERPTWSSSQTNQDKVFRLVDPEHRLGRGMWWRPDSQGYTDHIEDAGLYCRGAHQEGEGRHYTEVPAGAALDTEIGQVVRKLNRLGDLVAKL